MTSGSVGTLERWWFVILPRWLDRYVPLLADSLLDGAWMLAWRGVAVGAPLLALVVGLLAPTHWPGYHISYLAALPYLAFAIVVSIFSGAAGVMLLVGTILGDVLFSRDSPFALRSDPRLLGGPTLAPARQAAWLLVEYTVLGLLVVRAPQSARGLVEDVVRRIGRAWLSRARWGVLLVRMVLFAGLMGVLVFLWSQAAVPLDRAVTVFIGLSMGELAPPIQRGGWRVLVITAVLCGAARIALEDWAVHQSARASVIVEVYRQRWSGVRDRGGLWAALPDYLRMGLTAAGTLLLLAGIVDGFFEALVAGVAVSGIQVIRHRLYRLAPAAWLRTLSRVPGVVRLAIGVAGGYALLNQLLLALNRSLQAPTYRELLFAALFMMGVFAVLFPASRPMADGQRALP
jgi:hypothetical protein